MLVRKQRLAAGLVPVVVAAIALGALPAGAEDQGSGLPPYIASAAADGMRFSLNSPGAPITANVIDGGGPTAEARLSPTSGPRSFAALPYPGDIFLAGPSTAAGLLAASGAALPSAAPGYPMIASAAQPGTGDQTVGGGPYELQAHAKDNSASSMARFGLDANGTVQALFSQSDASTTQSENTVVSKATNVARGVTVGPLKLASVTSVAQVELDAGGALKRTSSLEVVLAEAGGTPLVLKASGPPEDFAKAVAQFSQQIKPTGVQVTATPQADTADGVLAPVLWVRMLTPSSPLFGAATWTVASGRTSAAITTEATQAAAPAQESATPDSASPDSASPGTTAGSGSGTANPTPTAAREALSDAASPSGRAPTASGYGGSAGFAGDTIGSAGSFAGAGQDGTGPGASAPAGAAETALAAAAPAAGPPESRLVALAGNGRRGTEPYDLGVLYIVVAVAGLAGALLGGVFKVRAAWKF